jgi:hypothetical protein
MNMADLQAGLGVLYGLSTCFFVMYTFLQGIALGARAVRTSKSAILAVLF